MFLYRTLSAISAILSGQYQVRISQYKWYPVEFLQNVNIFNNMNSNMKYVLAIMLVFLTMIVKTNAVQLRTNNTILADKKISTFNVVPNNWPSAE